MDSDNYRILGAGILIGAFTVVVIWLLSGEVSYEPERDFAQRGAPLIITQIPATSVEAIELQPLPLPESSPLPLVAEPEELVITELATTLPVVPDPAPPAPSESATAIASTDSASIDSAADLSPPAESAAVQQLEQAIAASDSDIDSAINAIGTTSESYWRIDIASFRDPDRANDLVDKLTNLLQDQLGAAEIFTNRGLRKRSNDYFYTVVIANLPDEESARRLSIPIKEAYPDIRNPRIREIKQ